MTKKQMAIMEKLFRAQLIKEGKEIDEQAFKAFIRSERKKMKRLKHAGALS